ncbi:unnamed protein product, partial [Larinioides sclopetarius]
SILNITQLGASKVGKYCVSLPLIPRILHTRQAVIIFGAGSVKRTSLGILPRSGLLTCRGGVHYAYEYRSDESATQLLNDLLAEKKFLNGNWGRQNDFARKIFIREQLSPSARNRFRKVNFREAI